jgi:hypothetical protein
MDRIKNPNEIKYLKVPTYVRDIGRVHGQWKLRDILIFPFDANVQY